MGDEILSSTIRILAYIDEYYGPPVKGPRLMEVGRPEVPDGYVLDVTLEIQVETAKGQNQIILQHYGDGAIYRSLEKAEQAVRRNSGFVVQRIPAEKMKRVAVRRGPCRCAAFLEREFVVFGGNKRARVPHSVYRDRRHKSRLL